MQRNARRVGWLLCVVLASLAVSGCGRNAGAPAGEPLPRPDAGAAHDSEGIHWRRGHVDAAFAEARAAGKPVFLYWGAAWCPPCNALKATVFRRPDFIARTRAFVPVYIDGDAEGAQALQDRFGAMGYPTLIVFDPEGREITRIPGGLDLGRYMDVLGMALEHVSPVAEIVRRLQDEGRAPDEAGWRLLASYAWHQDAGRALGGRDRDALLARLVEACPASQAGDCRRLRETRLSLWLAAVPEPDRADCDHRLAELALLLAQDPAPGEVPSFLQLDAPSLLENCTDAGSGDRAGWVARLRARTTGAAPGTAQEQLWALVGEATLARVAGELDEPRRAALREAVERGLAALPPDDPAARSAGLNAAVHALAESGQEATAREILARELGDSPWAWYWMLDIAQFEEQAGRPQEALRWLREAWQGARGPATRVQWGGQYVMGLMRLSPDDVPGVRAGLDALFDELEAAPASLHGRNLQALGRIGSAMTDWSGQDAARSAVREEARARVSRLCAAEPGLDAAAQATCAALL